MCDMDKNVKPKIEISPIQGNDRFWIREVFNEHWGSPQIVSRGTVHQADLLPGFIARIQVRPVGLITYSIQDRHCEITSINSIVERIGIGSELINTIKETARDAGCIRLWLVTTNDNTPALTFYQKIGFQITALHKDAIETSRKLKPEIPARGYASIPIRDEIELELRISSR